MTNKKIVLHLFKQGVICPECNHIVKIDKIDYMQTIIEYSCKCDFHRKELKTGIFKDNDCIEARFVFSYNNCIYTSIYHFCDNDFWLNIYKYSKFNKFDNYPFKQGEKSLNIFPFTNDLNQSISKIKAALLLQ